jgi:hypothetical protein
VRYNSFEPSSRTSAVVVFVPELYWMFETVAPLAVMDAALPVNFR